MSFGGWFQYLGSTEERRFINATLTDSELPAMAKVMENQTNTDSIIHGRWRSAALLKEMMASITAAVVNAGLSTPAQYHLFISPLRIYLWTKLGVIIR